MGHRQLLKNLGRWLGLIFIGRDQPIFATQLDLKALLLDALIKGDDELFYIVPFVAKVLSASHYELVRFTLISFFLLYFKFIAFFARMLLDFFFIMFIRKYLR